MVDARLLPPSTHTQTHLTTQSLFLTPPPPPPTHTHTLLSLSLSLSLLYTLPSSFQPHPLPPPSPPKLRSLGKKLSPEKASFTRSSQGKYLLVLQSKIIQLKHVWLAMDRAFATGYNHALRQGRAWILLWQWTKETLVRLIVLLVFLFFFFKGAGGSKHVLAVSSLCCGAGAVKIPLGSHNSGRSSSSWWVAVAVAACSFNPFLPKNESC